MPKKPHISEEDKALFRDSVKGTRRLKSDTISKSPPETPSTKRRSHSEPESGDFEQPDWSDKHESDYVEAETQLEYAKSGVDYKTLQKLHSGHFRIEATLDLHGYTAEHARATLSQFIQRQSLAHRRCVCIIHGKGKRGGMPVIKSHVNHWLRQSRNVVAFTSAPPKYGGTGAVLVLIKEK